MKNYNAGRRMKEDNKTVITGTKTTMREAKKRKNLKARQPK